MKSTNDEIIQPDKEKQNFNLILSYRNSAGIDKAGLLMWHYQKTWPAYKESNFYGIVTSQILFIIHGYSVSHLGWDGIII